MGPPLVQNSETKQEVSPTEGVEKYGPEPIQVRPLVLVLSSGVVKGYAHSGVLEALASYKIPVGAIVGAEMGALIGAIYASDGNVNHLQWELMKFKEEVFKSERGFFPSHQLNAELIHVFKQKDIRDSKIPCVLAIQLEKTGKLELISRGLTKDAVRAAIAFPELLGPGQWNGTPAVSARNRAASVAAMIHEAKALQIGPVLVVDFASDKIAERDFSEADLVLHPDLNGIDDFDFKKRTEAIFRGKKAVMDHLKEIYHWAGMPQGDE